MHPALAVVIRVAVVLLVEEIAARVADIGMDPNGGANIGAGLLAFAAAIIVSFGWGCVDGARSAPRPARDSRAVWIVWAVTALLVGVAAAFRAQGWSLPPDGAVLADDLGVVTPFVAALVAVPAAAGLGLGLLASRLRRRRA